MKFKDIFSYFLLFTTAFLFSTNIAPAIIFNEHTISDDYPGAHFVYAVDMDGDDDIDVLGTAYNADVISWWENDGEQEFDEHIIADNFDGPRSVDPVDMDGDGDMDVLGTAYVAPGYIAWWENDGDEGFTQHTISSNFDGAFSAMAVDIDGDDDVDVIAAARVANRLSWFANDGNQNFTEYAVSANFDGAISVYAADVDDDGDMDVLGAAQDADDITWWEQFDAGRPAFNENNISGNFNGAMSVYAEDIDGDDDIDVLGSGYEGNQVGWWENDGDQEFTENIIMRNFNIGYRVLATDVDGDGDMDILGCAKEADKVSWFENDGNQEFDEHIIVSNYDGATGLHFADVDDDGDMDILSTAVYGNELTWWENDSPPAPFDLYEPINDSLLSEQPVILRWYGTYDPDRDPEDAVTYYVEIGLDEDYNDSELYEAGEDTFYNFDDVVDDLDYWWRVFAEDVNEGNIRISNQSWHISTSFPPTEFDLATPDSGSIHTDDAIELSWEVSEDPGDGNILYDLYISDDPGNFEEPFELNLGENSYDFRPPNELDYYWTVHARDMNTDGTWSNSVWSFYADRPDRPSNFSLIEPESGTVFPSTEPLDIETVWHLSIDPDFNEDVTYNLNFGVTLNGEPVEYIGFDGLRDTTYTINITEELNLQSWEDTLDVTWWVTAVSGDDEVECNQRYEFYLEPNSSTVNEAHNGLPEKFIIEAVYPNPFNPSMSIIIALPEQSILQVSIYNIVGQQIAVLADGSYTAGFHRFAFDGIDFTSGIYFIHSRVPGKMDEVKKVVLMK